MFSKHSPWFEATVPPFPYEGGKPLDLDQTTLVPFTLFQKRVEKYNQMIPSLANSLELEDVEYWGRWERRTKAGTDPRLLRRFCLQDTKAAEPVH